MRARVKVPGMAAAACGECGSLHDLVMVPRCHPGAPTRISSQSSNLVVRCYVPECSRVVVILELEADVDAEAAAGPDQPKGCDLCRRDDGQLDVFRLDEPLDLLDQHLVSPVKTTLTAGCLVVRCYVADCGREIARFPVVGYGTN